MNKLLLSVLLLGSIACVSAVDTLQISGGVVTGPVLGPGQVEPFATTLSRWLVDTVAQKIVAVARFFQVKVRLVRFLVSLYTTENLMLLRNLIEYGVKFGNLALRFLPATTEDPGYWWIPAVTQFLNVDTGHGGLLGLVLGEPRDPSLEDSAEDSSENVEEIVTNPPIFFNVPANSTERSDSANEVSSDSIRAARSTVREPNYVNEKDPQIVDKERERQNEILKTYQGRIMSLDKLINSRKK